MATGTISEVLQGSAEGLRELAKGFDKGTDQEDDRLYSLLASFSIPSLPEKAWGLLVDYQPTETSATREAVRHEVENIRAVIAALDDAEYVGQTESLYLDVNKIEAALNQNHR